MNNIRLYRRLRGGIWIKFFDKSENGGSEYWVRFYLTSDAMKYLQVHHHLKPIDIGVYENYISIELINLMIKVKDAMSYGNSSIGSLSDGYHTFDELYAHRNMLFAVLCNLCDEARWMKSWKSKRNSDGSVWAGWFVAGIGDGKVTYHMPMSMWDYVNVSEISVGKWDGHTSEQVLNRLPGLFKMGNHKLKIVSCDITDGTTPNKQGLP